MADFDTFFYKFGLLAQYLVTGEIKSAMTCLQQSVVITGGFEISQQDQLLDGWKRTQGDHAATVRSRRASSKICRRAVSVLVSGGLAEGNINKKNASRSIGGFGHLCRYKPCCWPHGLDIIVS